MPMCTSQVADTGATPPATAQAQVGTTPSATPEVHPFTAVGDVTKAETPNSVFYDFGTLSLARTQPITHSFTLHNDTGAPIDIARIQAACGCTTATTDNGVPGNYKPVEPGKDLTLNVAIDPGHLYAGNIDKMVWVYVPNQSVPAFTMHITGTMNPVATFAPAVLNFQTIQDGTATTQKLTVSMDAGAYGQNPPDPISTNEDLTVVRDNVPETVSATNQIVRVYDITVSKHAHIGALQGTIGMPRPNDPGHPGIGPSVFVTGTVMGDVSAAPNSVAFGAVTMGKTFTQQVVLTGISPKAVQGLKVKCGDKTLSGTIKNIQAQSAVLQVSFVPATIGSMQSQVSIITKSGQQLDLPVWAWVNNAQ